MLTRSEIIRWRTLGLLEKTATGLFHQPHKLPFCLFPHAQDSFFSLLDTLRVTGKHWLFYRHGSLAWKCHGARVNFPSPRIQPIKAGVHCQKPGSAGGSAWEKGGGADLCTGGCPGWIFPAVKLCSRAANLGALMSWQPTYNNNHLRVCRNLWDSSKHLLTLSGKVHCCFMVRVPSTASVQRVKAKATNKNKRSHLPTVLFPIPGGIF